MKALRILLALLLLSVTVAAITRQLVPRVRCNLMKGQVNRDVRRFARSGYEYDRIVRARRNLQRCNECLAKFPEDHQLYLLRGANLRMLGSYDEAVHSFEQALALVERPEIYAQLGELEIERGNVEAARRALLRAATFNIMYVETVDEPMRTEIYKQVYDRIERLRAAGK
jgi:tetratricopeptide (TPR) repeat protein